MVGGQNFALGAAFDLGLMKQQQAPDYSGVAKQTRMNEEEARRKKMAKASLAPSVVGSPAVKSIFGDLFNA